MKLYMNLAIAHTTLLSVWGCEWYDANDTVCVMASHVRRRAAQWHLSSSRETQRGMRACTPVHAEQGRKCERTSCTAALSFLCRMGKAVRGRVVVVSVVGVRSGYGIGSARRQKGQLLGHGVDRGEERVHVVRVDAALVADARFASVVVRSRSLLGRRPASVSLLGDVQLQCWPRP